MKKNMGFNLIELLISLLVVAIGLFAIAKMQILGIHGVEQSKSSTASTIIVGNVIERLSKQRDAIRIYLDKYGTYTRTGSQLDSGFAEHCSESDTDISEGSSGKAQNALDCEISYWVESLVNAMKLGASDGCYRIIIEDSAPYAYKAVEETENATYYKIPKIKVSILWNQISGSSALTADMCNAFQESGLHQAPAIKSNIGFSTMEYLAP